MTVGILLEEFFCQGPQNGHRGILRQHDVIVLLELGPHGYLVPEITIIVEVLLKEPRDVVVRIREYSALRAVALALQRGRCCVLCHRCGALDGMVRQDLTVFDSLIDHLDGLLRLLIHAPPRIVHSGFSCLNDRSILASALAATCAILPVGKLLRGGPRHRVELGRLFSLARENNYPANKEKKEPVKNK